MKILRKYFSKKEDYKNGAETKHQIRTRRRGARLIIGGSALTGTVIGGDIASKKIEERSGKILKKANKEFLRRSKAVSNAIEQTSGKVRPQDMDKYMELLGNVRNRMDNSLKSIKKFDKSANKVIKKAAKKGSMRGALIGTAVGGSLAYVANKSAKKTNERINKARRNKNSIEE